MCKTEYGFSNLRKLGFVKKGHRVSVAVVRTHMGLGIGKALVLGALDGVRSRKCDEMCLEARCTSTAAVRMYQGMEFSIRQRLGTYYKDGEVAFLMSIEPRRGMRAAAAAAS